MSDNTNNILNEEKALNESFNKLYEDWDKAGVMPHTVLGLNNLGLGKLAAGAAGLAALAGTALGKGAIWLGKQATMKRAFLKVLKRIAEIEDYVINGAHAENYRYSATLPNGKKISSIKHYDEIRQEILDEITKDTEEFEEFKNSFANDRDRTDINNQASLVNAVNKYKKFFGAINRNFGLIKGGGDYNTNDEDIYNKLQETIKTNLGFADTYVNSIITKFKTKYTIGKEDNPRQNKRLEKYVMALKEAWENVKKEILLKYKKLAIDICRSAEFKKLYDIVSELYKEMPNTVYAINKILSDAYESDKYAINHGKNIKPWVYIEDTSTQMCIITKQDNSTNYDLLHSENLINDVLSDYNKIYKTDYILSRRNGNNNPSFGFYNWSPQKDNNGNLTGNWCIDFSKFPKNNLIKVIWECEFSDMSGHNIGTGKFEFEKSLIKK